VIIDSDRELLEHVKEFRLVTIEQLERLTGRRTIWRRLKVEPPAPLIESRQVFYKKPKNKNLPYVFSDHPIERRSENRLDHELLITDIHIALYKTGYLVLWQQGKETWRGSVHQDAFAILHTEKGRLHLFIEADTGSENHQQIAGKLQTYSSYPDKPFRLLFVTVSQLRAQNLARIAESIIAREERKYYLFTSADLLRESTLAPICYVPFELNQAVIIPGLAAAPTTS
jgi:hypothetical protein